MQTRRLGRSGFVLSSTGFGGGPVGWATAPDADAVAGVTLTAAWELGIRYFDTAPYYGFGKSEKRIGRFLRMRPRNEFVLSSKVGRLIRPAFEGDLSPSQVRFDYSRDGTMRSIEDSLLRCDPNLDIVDLRAGRRAMRRITGLELFIQSNDRGGLHGTGFAVRLADPHRV